MNPNFVVTILWVFSGNLAWNWHLLCYFLTFGNYCLLYDTFWRFEYIFSIFILSRNDSESILSFSKGKMSRAGEQLKSQRRNSYLPDKILEMTTFCFSTSVFNTGVFAFKSVFWSSLDKIQAVFLSLQVESTWNCRFRNGHFFTDFFEFLNYFCFCVTVKES